MSRTKIRFILCIFLFTAYMLFGVEQRNMVKQQLKPDYSNNVFDFISELSYTLSYEKISVK